MALLAAATPQVGDAVGGAGGGLQTDLREVSGSAVGTILMPTTTELGILVAVGQTADSRVFMLDAELTSAVPGLFDPHTRVAFGGVYGRLFEAPSGGGEAFDGVVEGMWRLDGNLIGTYQALVYEQQDVGGLKLVGRIQGAFQVSADDSGEAVPGPVINDPDGMGTRTPYGDDIVWVRDEKPSDARFGDGQSAPDQGVNKDEGATYSGLTKLGFKLVD